MFTNDIALTVIVTTMLILLLIAGVVITIFLANRRHVQQQVKMTQMELNYEKELRMVEHEVQEQVLTNVARELHDNIGQLLTFMRIQIENEKLDDPQITSRLLPVDNTLTDIIQQVRMLSKSLNSDMLENGGLLNGIQLETQRLQHIRNFSVHFDSDEVEPVLNKNQRIMVFRIFQEILNNMLKHAEARNIYIVISGKGHFKLIMSDDGKGFEVPEKETGSGSGLINIMKRARLANLVLNIDTAPGKGSTFTISES
jgi:signal transduction histidine kinase